MQIGAHVVHFLLQHPQLIQGLLFVIFQALAQTLLPVLSDRLHPLLQRENPPVFVHLRLVHLPHQVTAQVRALGKDAAPHAQIEGHDAGPRAEARQQRGVQRPEPHPRHAAQGQGGGQQAPDGARVHAHLHGPGQVLPHHRGQPAGALDGRADPHVGGDEVQQRPRTEAGQRAPARGDVDVAPGRHKDQDNHGKGAGHVDLHPLCDQHIDVHGAGCALGLQQHGVGEEADRKEPQRR
mmetsp:Transcript_12595/g.29881  ORF Transcript_12595/g.29881 Transcript_12595/m.29881 type:complete len:237 (-) Transcript_12595:351-1061(-)